MLPLIFSIFVYGFNPAITTNGDLTISIPDLGKITTLGMEIPVKVVLKNSGSETINGELLLEVIDNWKIIGEPKCKFNLKGDSEQEITFICVAGKGTYSAHYPIHAKAFFDTPSGKQSAHTVLVVEVDPIALSSQESEEQKVLELKSPGRILLNSLKDAIISFRLGEDGEIMTKPFGWHGTDEVTGTYVDRTYVDRGEYRSAISAHPPWRKGWGIVWLDYIVQLPNDNDIFLDFATAIRDNYGEEPPSDGVQFQILVADFNTKEYKLIFDRFSDAKQWESATVSLKQYSGKKIKLRLLTSPGPRHDTTCDQAYWAEPTIIAGIKPYPKESEKERQSRIQKNKEQAEQALKGRQSQYTWKLQDNIVVSLTPGQFGAIDTIITFATPKGQLTIDGFNVEVDGRKIGNWQSGFEIDKWHFEDNTFRLPIIDGEKKYDIAIKIWSEDEGLRVRFSIEGIERDNKGEPKFTHISLGKIDQKVRRLYAGHGNVLEEPGIVNLVYDGFNLSTSFAGFDFANGISLVQATDIPPDSVRINPEKGIATLSAHHDLTLTLVPSLDGAFDSAKKYRKIFEPRMSPGVLKIIGKMCLDQWGGDYARASEGIEKAVLYGLTDSVFVKHVWQRWGYDYRLPDIYPPEGNWDDFMKMVNACKRNGILFAPHDNYIDFYPDATGFSYKHIIFNSDHTPQRAWYNAGRKAQSYRWLSHAFKPWMENNFKLIKEGFGPTSYFIDVFSAITPMDYYDEEGNFYSKEISIKSWKHAFDRVREVFDGAPTISEAGHDALLGHLDSAQADHLGWTPEGQSWAWSAQAKDGERIPWHDMVTHGKFILFAGGLGNRYSGSGQRELHGYGSDDYLNMTVLGGRNPMCDGPFNRDAVMTYWLLHDVCADLAQQDIEKHTFVDNDIHRQIVDFANGGKVIANRGKSDWEVERQILPSYGFIAQSGEYKAMVTRRDGIISAYSESPDAIFADARPPEHTGRLPIKVEIIKAESLGGRKFALISRWTVQSQSDTQGRTFIHFTNSRVATEGEDIAFQAGFPIGPEQWQKPGIYEIRTESELPPSMPAGEYGIRFGIYQPERGGRRLRLITINDEHGRSIGGSLIFKEKIDGSLSVQLIQAPKDPVIERLNNSRTIVNFGAIKTNGAFRFIKNKKMIIPLPESQPFEIILNLPDLNIKTEIMSISALNEDLQKQEDIEFSIDDGHLRFITKKGFFAYRLIIP